MTIPAEQGETAALLRRLAGREPIQTHISAVFVGPDTVYKMKKAVRLPFLDFSTLGERHRTVLRELELNAPHAPGLYRDVVAVTRGDDGALVFGGDGAPVDWVLRMAPIPGGDFLEHRLPLAVSLLDGLADAVAAMHASQPVCDVDQEAAFRHITDGNAVSARAAGLDPGAWHASARAALADLGPWLKGRAARRIHGDLHLGNLCLWQGRPTPFDALEFNEEMATLDVGYDLAFLLMDLDVRDSRAAANRVFNRYIARTADYGLVAGLAFFLSQRAMIRAHIAAGGGRAEEARAYFERALAYLRPSAGRVIAIGGLPGSGKSTLARALAPGLGRAPGALVLRSDEIRKRQHGVPPEQKLPQRAYSTKASRAVFGELFRAVAEVASAGHAVIADAMFLDLGHRREIARAAGTAPFLGLWLHAAMDVLRARIAARQGDASDADVGVLERAAVGDPGAGDWVAVSGEAEARHIVK